MSLDVLLTDETYGIIPDWFECDWEVQEILHMTLCYKDHEFEIAKVLRSSDVLTGGRSSFKATVCKKYMTDQWRSIGLDLLDSATSGLDSVASDRECEFVVRGNYSSASHFQSLPNIGTSHVCRLLINSAR